jgi:hypothetical protein
MTDHSKYISKTSTVSNAKEESARHPPTTPAERESVEDSGYFGKFENGQLPRTTTIRYRQWGAIPAFSKKTCERMQGATGRACS